MPEMTLEIAKQVCDEGLKHNALAWDDPNSITDQIVLDKAKELVDIATQFSANGSVNDGVLAILHAAHVTPQSEVSLEAYTQRFGTNGNSNLQSPASSEAQNAVSEEQVSSAFVGSDAPASEEPAKETAPVAEDISDVFPGYDGFGADGIKSAILESAASGDLTVEEWERIRSYETLNQARQPILLLKPEFKTEQSAVEYFANGAQDEPQPEPTQVPKPKPEPLPEPTQVPSGTVTHSTVPVSTAPEGDGSLESFYNGQSASRAQQEGLPIPPNPQAEASLTLPVNITEVSSEELSRLATAYHSLFARTQWLQSQEEGRERAAEGLEHDAHRDAFARAMGHHESAIDSEKRTASAVENARRQAGHDADNNDVVRKYRTAKIRHGIDARELKALASTYDRGVWRITDELNRRVSLSKSSPAVR